MNINGWFPDCITIFNPNKNPQRLDKIITQIHFSNLWIKKKPSVWSLWGIHYCNETQTYHILRRKFLQPVTKLRLHQIKENVSVIRWQRVWVQQKSPESSTLMERTHSFHETFMWPHRTSLDYACSSNPSPQTQEKWLQLVLHVPLCKAATSPGRSLTRYGVFPLHAGEATDLQWAAKWAQWDPRDLRGIRHRGRSSSSVTVVTKAEMCFFLCSGWSNLFTALKCRLREHRKPRLTTNWKE